MIKIGIQFWPLSLRLVSWTAGETSGDDADVCVLLLTLPLLASLCLFLLIKRCRCNRETPSPWLDRDVQWLGKNPARGKK